MDKTTDGTKLFVRFLRERGIKYIFTEEVLRNAYRKYKRKESSHFLNGMNGNSLKYFDKFFSRGLYNVISRSFVWNSTKNGYNFWARMQSEWVWEWDRYRQVFIKN